MNYHVIRPKIVNGNSGLHIDCVESQYITSFKYKDTRTCFNCHGTLFPEVLN